MEKQQAEALARQFDAVNREVMTWVENCPADRWQQTCPHDERTAGVVAHHIAASHGVLTHFVTLIAQGQPLPELTVAALDQANAHHAEQFANVVQAEVLELLRTSGAATVATVSQLTDEQLAHSAYLSLFGTTMSAQQVIEHILLGHARSHLANLQVLTSK